MLNIISRRIQNDLLVKSLIESEEIIEDKIMIYQSTTLVPLGVKHVSLGRKLQATQFLLQMRTNRYYK